MGNAEVIACEGFLKVGDAGESFICKGMSDACSTFKLELEHSSDERDNAEVADGNNDDIGVRPALGDVGDGVGDSMSPRPVSAYFMNRNTSNADTSSTMRLFLCPSFLADVRRWNLMVDLRLDLCSQF